MKFDAYAATVFWSPEDTLSCLQAHLGGSLKPHHPRHGYEAAVLLELPKANPVLVQWGSKHEGTHVSVMGHVAGRVADVIREHLADHNVSRADVCEDYTCPGAWGVIVDIALGVADKLGIVVRHEGDWHRGEKGRTIYLGSNNSEFQVCIYEKGKQLGADPEWVRVEYRLRPQSRNKSRYAMASPAQIAQAAPWAGYLWSQLNQGCEPDRVITTPVPKADNLAGRVANMVGQYYRVILDLADQVDYEPEQLGARLFELAVKQAHQGRAAASEASALFFPDGDEV